MDRLSNFLVDNLGIWSSVVKYAILIPICTVSLLCYGAARVFIVIESFISMRSLPVGSYETVLWTSFWPHLRFVFAESGASQEFLCLYSSPVFFFVLMLRMGMGSLCN